MRDFFETSDGITIRCATRDDLVEALRVQRVGFTRVEQRLQLLPGELPPVRESLEELHDLYDDGMITLIATVPGPGGGESVIGTVRGMLQPDGTVEIGRLAVDDGYLRRGVATRLMLALERVFPEATRFQLFTGSEATEPLALYAKLGYRIFRQDEYESWSMVWLEKDVVPARSASDTQMD